MRNSSLSFWTYLILMNFSKSIMMSNNVVCISSIFEVQGWVVLMPQGSHWDVDRRRRCWRMDDERGVWAMWSRWCPSMLNHALDHHKYYYEWPRYLSQDLKTPFWPGSHTDDNHSSSEESSNYTKKHGVYRKSVSLWISHMIRLIKSGRYAIFIWLIYPMIEVLYGKFQKIIFLSSTYS